MGRAFEGDAKWISMGPFSYYYYCLYTKNTQLPNGVLSYDVLHTINDEDFSKCKCHV